MTIPAGMLNTKVVIKPRGGAQQSRRVKVNSLVDAFTNNSLGIIPDGSFSLTMREDSYTKNLGTRDVIELDSDDYAITDIRPRYDGSRLLDIVVRRL